MGMAASQARLLCLTARIHDVEYQAQAIQNAKLQLATQSDQAYAKYNEALDATTLTIRKINPSSGEESVIPANFNNLCSKNKAFAANGRDYALFDKYGRLIVEDDIAEAYDKFSSKNAYAFALYLIDGGAIGNLDDEKNDFENAIQNAELKVIQDSDSKALNDIYKSIVKLIKENLDENFNPGFDIYDENNGSTIFDLENDLISLADLNNVDKADILNTYNSLMAQLRNNLYKSSLEDVYKNAQAAYDENSSIDSDEFNYYVNIFNQIQAAGGCVSINAYRGNINEVDVSNDSEWLQAMVKCGQISIATVSYNKETRAALFNATGTSSDDVIAETATTTIDKRALAKAEAEYEHALKSINKKDKEYDLSLSKLEAERTALKTEYDSVKKVISENIERTFGIFS